MRLHFSAGTVFATESNSSKLISSILPADKLRTANFDFYLQSHIVDKLLMRTIVLTDLCKKVENEKSKFVVYILQLVYQFPHALGF